MPNKKDEPKLLPKPLNKEDAPIVLQFRGELYTGREIRLALLWPEEEFAIIDEDEESEEE